VTGTSILGHPVQRLEDRPILAGVDTEAAAKMPGVVAVHTADDLGLPDIPAFAMAPPVMSRPPLARGTVRFVGDTIAVVIAETAEQAVDAAGEVVVDYDPLPAVADP